MTDDEAVTVSLMVLDEALDLLSRGDERFVLMTDWTRIFPPTEFAETLASRVLRKLRSRLQLFSETL